MSMFDRIEYEGKEYQTKDLDCTMTTYIINDEGRLMVENFHLEELPRDQWDEFDKKIGFGNKRISDGMQDTNYHGMLNFYTSDQERNVWIEYSAKFTDGQLVDIVKEETKLNDMS